MSILKIVNLVGSMGGTLDYKGLDIEQFIPGSQFYADDLSFALCRTTQGEIPNHADIEIITDVQYETIIAAEIANRPKPLEDQLADLKTDLIATQQALNMILGV